MTEQTKTQTPDLASLLGLVTQMPALQPLIWHNAQAVGTPEAPAIDRMALHWICLYGGTVDLAVPTNSLVEMSQGDPGPFVYNPPGWLPTIGDPIPHDKITHYSPCIFPGQPTNVAPQPLTTDQVAEALARIDAADQMVNLLAGAIRQELATIADRAYDIGHGSQAHLVGPAGKGRDYAIRIMHRRSGAYRVIDWPENLTEWRPV